MNEEYLSEAEIGARFPNEWVLIEQAELDEQLRIVRGIVAAHDRSKDAVEAAARARQAGRVARPFAVQFIGELPDAIYLLSGRAAQ